MSGPSRLLGAVLAGGASSRFGSDKALARVGGRTLLDHARAALIPLVDAIVVVGRGAGVPDRPVSGLGPLGGIAGALDHAEAHGFDSVLTIGCDMPGVPAALLAALAARAPAYCPDAPIVGHWPVTLERDLIDRLAGVSPTGGKVTRLSVRHWALAIGAVAVPAPAPLVNVNTPADLPAS